MDLIKDIIWPENIIRIRFLPLVIAKVIIGVLLAPALVACAWYISFMIEPAWPQLIGRGIIPLLIAVPALTVYLMLRFVIMLTADVFTSEKLIIRCPIPIRRSIRWRDISSVELRYRKNIIAVNTENGRRFEIKGFRGVKLRDKMIINDDCVERAPYKYRFNSLYAGVPLNRYIKELRRFIPEEIIIEMM